MKLKNLPDGARFEIVRTGQTGRKIGTCGTLNHRVVVMDGFTRLTNFNHQVEVKVL